MSHIDEMVAFLEVDRGTAEFIALESHFHTDAGTIDRVRAELAAEADLRQITRDAAERITAEIEAEMDACVERHPAAAGDAA